MPNETEEIIHIVNLCSERQVHSLGYDILFFPIINIWMFGGISEFAEAGYSLGEIMILIFGFIMILAGILGIVTETFDWFRSRPIIKKIKSKSLSSEEMKVAITELSKVNHEFKKQFILGKTYNVYCMEKANAI